MVLILYRPTGGQLLTKFWNPTKSSLRKLTEIQVVEKDYLQKLIGKNREVKEMETKLVMLQEQLEVTIKRKNEFESKCLSLNQQARFVKEELEDI